VAIVGTRTASAYAVETAHEVARALSVAGVTVVSGLARGVDGAAHRGALAGGGRTIAVLGCGADVPYPASHRRLYSRVAEAAAIVSELPPGTPARPWAFPARNRIMAGLASFVLVVEAAERSGTLITAEFALDMGRELGAVPGRVNHRMAAGSNRLLKDGATVVRDPEDILDAVCGVGVRPARARVTADLDPAARAVLDAIEAGDSPRAAGALEARHLRVALGRLEALGLVRRDGLGGYERTGAR
jgi:DNA processing protein